MSATPITSVSPQRPDDFVDPVEVIGTARPRISEEAAK
jgi:hypothetical protein